MDPRWTNRQKSPDGTTFLPPGDMSEWASTDQPDVFVNRRTGEFMRVPPMKDQMTIMGLIPLLGGQMGAPNTRPKK